MARTLVIGATGFIGSHLCRRLVAEGDEVVAMIRPGPPAIAREALPAPVATLTADLEDREALGACLREARAERIFFLASQTRPAMARTATTAQLSLANLRTILNFLEALCALPDPPRLVVRTGSIAEYGHVAVPFREVEREMPVTPYGASMLAGTQYLAMLAPNLPCPVATARLALVYGPGQPDSFFVASQIKGCIARRPVPVARPQDRRDLIHVEDAVDGLLALAANPPPGASILNIATGVAPRMAEVAEHIAIAAGLDPARIPIAPVDPADPPSVLLSDPSRARDWLGWMPRIRWEDGVASTTAHLLSGAGASVGVNA